MAKEGKQNMPRAIIQLINKRQRAIESNGALDDDIVQMIKHGQRFTADDIDKVERVAAILGRCHEMINKIEQFFSMRNSVAGMADISSQLIQFVD